MNPNLISRQSGHPRGPMAVAGLACVLVLGFLVLGAERAAAQASPSPQLAPITSSDGIKNSPYEVRDPAKGIGIEQRLDAQLPLDTRFIDDHGDEVRLGDFFERDRPVILALVYYECPMLCNQMMQQLVKNLRALSMDAGDEFDVVCISIDHGEDADLAGRAKAKYTKSYARDGTDDGWHFLVGDRVEIDRVCETVGYKFRYEAGIDEYAHAAGIQVCTSDGRLSRYFYGTDYPARDLRLGLTEASEGKIGSLVDQILLLCLTYDPTTGKYGLVIMNSLRIFGLLTAVALAAFVIFHLRREKAAKVVELRGTPAVSNQSNL